MSYYFGTPNQTNGDAAYEMSDYDRALQHYESALKTLNQRISSRERIIKSQFNYAYSFVLSEILYTKLVLVNLAIVDAQPYQDILNKIIGQHHELEVMSKNPLSVDDSIRIKTRCEDIDKKIGNVYEALSDCSADKFEFTKDLSDLFKALEHMESALSYYKTNTTMEQLYGFFNLLEQAFECTKDRRYLQKMQTHLPALKVIENYPNPAERMEGYAYLYILSANGINKELDPHFIKKNINECYKELSEIERNNQALTKIWLQINPPHGSLEREQSTSQEHYRESSVKDSQVTDKEETMNPETLKPRITSEKPQKRKIRFVEETSSKRSKHETSSPGPNITFFGSVTVQSNIDQEELSTNALKFIGFVHQLQRTSTPMGATFFANMLIVVSEALNNMRLIHPKICIPLIKYELISESIQFKETDKAYHELCKIEQDITVRRHNHYVKRSENKKQPTKEAFMKCLENFVDEINTYQKDSQTLNNFFYCLMSRMIKIFEKNSLFGSQTGLCINILKKYQKEQMIEPNAHHQHVSVLEP